MLTNAFIWFIRIFFLQVVFESISTENICQQCKSGVIECRKISGIYTVSKLSNGYNPVIEIPTGTCNINITEYQPSKNFIAIKQKDGDWIVNGQWVINTPGTYQGAGTTFLYDRDSTACHGECIHGHGPTTDTVVVQVIYSENNPGILYEFTLPPNVHYTSPLQIVPSHHRNRHNRHRSRTQGRSGSSESISNHHRNQERSRQSEHDGLHHRNQETLRSIDNGRQEQNYQSSQSYGSHTLGGRGLSYTAYNSRTNQRSRQRQNIRKVQSPRYVSPYGRSDIYRNRYSYQALRSGQTQSRSANEETRSNSVPLLYPNPDRRNSITTVARYSWKIIGFSECSQTCGGGLQTTNIVCVLSSTQVVVTNDNCADQSKPVTQQLECNTSPCPPSWEVGEWTACSVTCGHGIQRRRAECKRRISQRVSLSVSASLCTSESKPAIIQQCNSDPCTRWQVGEWNQCSVNCGTGVKRRTLNCVDNGGNIVLKSLCTEPEPISSDSCDMGSCDYHWFLSSWSAECSDTCRTSVVTRQVHCATNTGRNISESYCDYSRKPDTQKQCSTNENCGNKWFAGPWSLCSSSCGSGIKTRDVSCVGRDGSDRMRILPERSCDLSIKPVERKVCEQTTCGSQWYMTDWSQCSVSCGNGTKNRYVSCLTQHKEPSTECDTLLQPENIQQCHMSECRTDLPARDPSCRNRYSNCRIVVQARLCYYKYYKKICCEACYLDEQKSHDKS